MGEPMKTDKDRRKVSVKRRDLLKLAGIGGVAGAAAAVGMPRESKAEAPDGAKGSLGYRETAHVKRYYELSRF